MATVLRQLTSEKVWRGQRKTAVGIWLDSAQLRTYIRRRHAKAVDASFHGLGHSLCECLSGYRVALLDTQPFAG